MTLATRTAARRHTHKPNGHAWEDADTCPLCGGPITKAARNQIHARLLDLEQQVKVKAQADVAAQVRRVQQEAAAATKVAVEKSRKDAAASLAGKITEAVAAAVGQEKQRAFADKLKLQEQLQTVQRKLEQRSSNSLGDEAEIDLHSAIRSEWSADEMVVERIKKGRNGVDVIVHVLHGGQTVGCVAIDSKNVSRWSNSWIGKMAADLIYHKSDFGIISTTAFRNDGARQIDVIDGIIACHPGRVVTLIHLLRRQIIAMHLLRLGNEARGDKKDQLYTFLTSDRATQLLDRITSLSGDLLALEEKERSSHLTVWNRRSELLKGLQGARNEFGTEIEQIVTGAATEASE